MESSAALRCGRSILEIKHFYYQRLKQLSILQAVGGWRQRQAVAQLRTGSSWLAVETGRLQGDVEVPRADRVCQRCSSAAIDDADHMVFDCSALESHRWNHPSLFTTRGSRSLSDFMDQDPTEVAAFVSECKKSCLALADG